MLTRPEVGKHVDKATGQEKRPLRKEAAYFAFLVLVGKHDGQNPRRLLRVCRIIRAIRHAPVVVIYLPKELVTGKLEAAEVVLAIRIVIGREVGEGANSLEHLGGQDGRERANARGDEHSATFERFAEGIVECSDHSA
jgi:hypothetical protein